MSDLAPVSGGSASNGSVSVLSSSTPGHVAQFLSFTIAKEEYGVDILDVREIKGWIEPTRLPNAPAYVRGVTNLRGTMVPVFDLRARFGLGATEPTRLHVIIIVAVERRIVGMLVDAVSDILTVRADQVQPAPETERAIDADFLKGLISVDGRMVALLTLERLFDLPRLARLAGPQSWA